MLKDMSDRFFDLLLAVQHDRQFAEAFDDIAATEACAQWSKHGKPPDLMVVYFSGPDVVGHAEGAHHIPGYVKTHLDPLLLGKLYECIEKSGYLPGSSTLPLLARSNWSSVVFVVVADHGQVQKLRSRTVVPWGGKLRQIDRICEYLSAREAEADSNEPSFRCYVTDPFMGNSRFLGFELHDLNHGLDDPATWMIYAPNGGLAHIYLRDQITFEDYESGLCAERWRMPPEDEFVLRVASLIYCAATTDEADEWRFKDPLTGGPIGFGINGSLGGVGKKPAVLVRLSETGGFDADYQWYAGWDGNNHVLTSLDNLVTSSGRGPEEWDMLVDRINQELKSERSGDILLIFDMKDGGWWTGPRGIKHDSTGEHGSPSPEESRVPLAFAFKPLQDEELAVENDFVKKAIDWRILPPFRRTKDMTPIILAIIGYARGVPVQQ